MFGRISKEEIGIIRSGKIYRINTRKRSCGQDANTFIETDYSPLLNEYESEEILPENPKITLKYSPFQPESSPKLESSNNQGIFCFPRPPTPHPPPLTKPPPAPPPHPRRNMVDDIKLLAFKGNGLEDLEQF